MPLPPRGTPEPVQISSSKTHNQRESIERDDMLDQISALEFESNKKMAPSNELPDANFSEE